MIPIPIGRACHPFVVQVDGDAAVVRFSGGDVALNDETISTLRGRLADLACEIGPRKLILDLANVRFVTSTALGMVVGLNRQLRSVGGRLVLRNLDDAVYEVFEVTKLTTVLDIERTAPLAGDQSASCGSAPPRRILVMDDDAGVRLMLQQVLRQEGFETSLAASGPEALDLFRPSADAIAVVLLDVRLPGWSGPETLAALRAVRPDVRCCFMTGDPGRYTVEDLMQLGAATVFQKPFSLTAVVQTVRRLAERSGSSAVRR